MVSRFIVALPRFALGLAFLYAAGDKVLNPQQFAQSIANYQILPLEWVGLFAATLPWLEVLVGFALLIGWFVPGAASLATAMLTGFAVALGSAIYRGLDIACGCFSADPGATANLMPALLRDLGLLALALAVLYVLVSDGREANPIFLQEGDGGQDQGE